MEPAARSLDFRNIDASSRSRPSVNKVLSSSVVPQSKAPQPTLTTEYTPMQRGGPAQNTATISISQAEFDTAPFPNQSQTSREQTTIAPDDGVDPTALPPAVAPPSHPSIEPTAAGVFDGRSILELDLSALAEKQWRRPGSDISDWFNYGFDELSWEAYCYRRRDLGELANVLKPNVINFAGMPEDQLIALPPEVRTMVMTGANAMMNNAAANSSMMGSGVMMDMSMMGPMAMGMNGDMNMGGPLMQGMMPDNTQVQQSGVGIVPGNGTPEHVGNGIGMMQDGFNPGAGGGNMMNIGMGGDFVMQEQNITQQMYPVMEAQNVAPVSSGRGTPVPFRGRGVPRARGFVGRGRGRGGLYGSDAPPPAPVRPASPLPPGVPTGPRNQNKYKDRDGNAPAVDGLDYGGGKEGMGRRTPSGEPEERMSSRKRRSSPGLDDIRGSKRR